MKRFFTVKAPSAGDLTPDAFKQILSQGTDDQGIDFAIIKLLSGAPAPSFDGAAFELTSEESQRALASSLFTPNGASQADYRSLCVVFGRELLEGYVADVASALSSADVERALRWFDKAPLNAYQGFIPTVRRDLSEVPEHPTIFPAAVKASMLGACDLFLNKFPQYVTPDGARPPGAPMPQLETLSADADLSDGGSYLVSSSVGAGVTLTLPPHDLQTTRSGSPVLVHNASTFSSTIQPNAGDSTILGAGASLTLAAGASVRLMTADDGGALWVQV